MFILNFASRLSYQRDTMIVRAFICPVVSHLQDIVLFHNNSHFLFSLQRAVTFSSYDHAAVIIRNPPEDMSPAALFLLESTGDGNDCFFLSSFPCACL